MLCHMRSGSKCMKTQRRNSSAKHYLGFIETTEGCVEFDNFSWQCSSSKDISFLLTITLLSVIVVVIIITIINSIIIIVIIILIVIESLMYCIVFIHFYSASLSLGLSEALPTSATDTVWEFTRRS